MAGTMPWQWNGTILRDVRGTDIAWVRDGVLTIAGALSGDPTQPDTLFDVETSLDGATASPRFFLRASPRANRSAGSEAAKQCEVSQAGLTVTRLRATCGDAHYLLERSAIFGKQRRILALDGQQGNSEGTEVARLTPRGSGLEVSASNSSGHGLPDVDAVVLSYGCLLVDATPRIVRG
ncbi:hypothetical protein ABRP93_01860 [Corynebacterium sp. KPL2850]|uniref:hypothetical protein n=1 Tax=Corynebacterium sp. KPL2850 TaxID=3158318 RepID=UPI0032EECC7C